MQILHREISSHVLSLFRAFLPGYMGVCSCTSFASSLIPDIYPQIPSFFSSPSKHALQFWFSIYFWKPPSTTGSNFSSDSSRVSTSWPVVDLTRELMIKYDHECSTSVRVLKEPVLHASPLTDVRALGEAIGVPISGHYGTRIGVGMFLFRLRGVSLIWFDYPTVKVLLKIVLKEVANNSF